MTQQAGPPERLYSRQWVPPGHRIPLNTTSRAKSSARLMPRPFLERLARRALTTARSPRARRRRRPCPAAKTGSRRLLGSSHESLAPPRGIPWFSLRGTVVDDVALVAIERW